MKTTVELPDALLREAKAYAAARGIPLRAVFESGLRRVLHPPRSAPKFKLKTITIKGEGLQVDGGWEAVRAELYQGRGA